MERQTEVETCPSCGSAMLVLRGLSWRGKQTREVVCKECKETWQLKRSVFAARLRP